MPKVTIWVKEEDYPIWKALSAKGKTARADWLHEMLQAAVQQAAEGQGKQ